MKQQQSLPIIGWREWVALPGLGIPAIKAKVDTGARSSCLHTFRQEEFELEGEAWLRFWIHPLQKDSLAEVVCEAPMLEKRYVRDSGGHNELRPVIMTPVRLGDQQWEIEITLSNREDMLFRMLLGRTALKGRMMINPALSFTLGAPDANDLLSFYPEV